MAAQRRVSLVAGVLVLLLAHGLMAIDVKLPSPPLPIMFDRNAQVTGAPPTAVRANETVTFSLVLDEQVLKKENDEVAQALLDAAAETNRLAGPELLVDEARLGVTESRLHDLRATYCDRARPLITAGTGRADLEEQFREVCVVGGTIDPTVLPTFDFLASATPYNVTLKCRDAAVPDVPAPAGSVANGRIPFTATPNKGCSDISYELRQIRPLAAAAAEWAKANPIPMLMLQDLESARKAYEKASPPAAKLLADNKDLKDCLVKASAILPGTAQDNAIVACTKATTAADAITLLQRATNDLTKASDAILTIFRGVAKPDSIKWVEKWLWFTAGHPTYHPLLTGGSSPTDLKNAKDQLALLDAQLAMIDKLAPSAKLDSAAALQESVAKLGKIKADRDAAAATVAKLTQGAADSATAHERDTLLYRGELFVTQPHGTLIAMRHHDAKANFVAMNSVAEIDETERLAVLVENADPSLQLNIAQTVTAISNDRGQFVDDLMLSAGQKNFGPANLAKAAKDFVDAYKILAALVTMGDEELITPASLIPLPSDQTPTLVTNIVPHDVPGPAPATVTYEIHKLDGTQDTKVGSGSYRLNHLYRARFRTGLIYSTLDQATVSSDGKTVTHTRHGADATFGVQTFFVRRDIRTISFASPAFSFYAGLTARDVSNNLLIGLGWEPIGGVTLTGGLHIGRSDRIDPNDANHVIEQWRRKPFVALTFDVDFLKQLITLKPTL